MEPQSPAPTVPGGKPRVLGPHWLISLPICIYDLTTEHQNILGTLPKDVMLQILKLKKKMISLANSLFGVICNEVGGPYSVPNILLYVSHFIVFSQKPLKVGDVSLPTFCKEQMEAWCSPEDTAELGFSVRFI